MTVSVDTLQLLHGRSLPGSVLVVEPHEAFIADDALRSSSGPPEQAHPAWFVIASLRCMGITVDELCALAHQEPQDVLLLGNCRVEQQEPLTCGPAYRATAEIGEVGSRHTRDGARLDSIEVVVRLLRGTAETESPVGTIVSTYLFKRGVDTA